MFGCNGTRMAVSSHILNGASIICLIISIFTNQWLFTKERVPEESGATHFMLTKGGQFVQSNITYWNRTIWSGMWSFCSISTKTPELPPECFWINHYTLLDNMDHTRLVDPNNVTTCVVYATIITMPSLISAAAVTVLGMVANLLIRMRKIWVFITGIIYITAGICTFTCLILYIAYVVQELDHKQKEKGEDGNPILEHWYGFSSILVMLSFCCQEMGGIGLIYLSIFQFKEHWEKKERQLTEQGRQLQMNNYPYNRNPDCYFPQSSRVECNHVQHRPYHSSLDQIEIVPMHDREQRMFYNSRNPYDTCMVNCSPKLNRKSLTVPDLDVRTREVCIGNHVRCSYNTPYCPSYCPPERRRHNHNPRCGENFGRLPRQVTFSDEELDVTDPRPAFPRYDLPNATYAQPRRNRPLRTSSLRMTPV